MEQSSVPSGVFMMGDSTGDGYIQDGESPRHRVELASFDIDTTTITNRQFQRFIESTGYVTDAESFGFSAVFHLLVSSSTEKILGQVDHLPWWVNVKGADWQHPAGDQSSLDELLDHPVVHVSWNDAQAYCAWAARALPTEAQWEYAARGGIEGACYPWGNEDIAGSDGAAWRANVWQGTFPAHNSVDDGWLSTAPVHSFEPNKYGLWQMVGNVWEWCEDWFSASTYETSQKLNPQGPNEGTAKILRGGSYLCHPSYCNRYRNSARSNNTPSSSMGNAGFRTVSLRGNN